MNPETDAANMITNTVVKVAVEGAEKAIKVSGSGAMGIAKIIAQEIKHPSKSKGKTSIRTLMQRSNVQKIFELKSQDLKDFAKNAKQYGLVYHVIRKKDTPNILQIMVNAEDAAKINRIYENLKIATPSPIEVSREQADQPLQNGEQEIRVTSDDPEFIDMLVDRRDLADPSSSRTDESHPSENSSADMKTDEIDTPVRVQNKDADKQDINPTSEKSYGENPTQGHIRDIPSDKMTVRKEGDPNKRPSVRKQLNEYRKAISEQVKRKREKTHGR